MAKQNSYGIKEVADVKFYEVTDDGLYVSSATYTDNADTPTIKWKNAQGADVAVSDEPSAVYEFDSLKVSNIEVASEETSAKGGKGNPELISWSYGKTATLTLTDALISMKTLDLMFGAKEELEGDDSASNILTIDSSSFPKPYQIVGTTVMRSYVTGQDEPFIFYIPKAQVQVGGTLTMEAEGDPSTFEMTVKALAQTCGTDKDVLVRFIRATKAN